MGRASTEGARETVPPPLVAALGQAAAGWEVFPCNPDKSPRTPNGFHDATTDPDALGRMPWDGALIGAAVPKGHVVIDIDPRNGGEETILALREAGHKLPATRSVRTGGGGLHLYYLVGDAELRGNLGRGIDVKRHGRGYVIVPPSEGYRVSKNRAVVKLPGWAAEALRAPEPDGSGDPSDPKFFDWESGTSYGMAACDSEIERLDGAGAGERNDTLNRAAFALAQLHAGGELDEEYARARLEDSAERIGLEQGETRKTIESAWRAGILEPRQAPLRDEIPAEAKQGLDAFAPGVGASMEHFWLDWTVEEAPPSYLLEPILPEAAYVLVYGPAEAAKSMVWAWIGSELSRRGKRVTLHSLENPPHVDRDRLRRLRPDPANFRATNEPLDLNDPRQFMAMVEREREWGTDLVIIDTYSHAFGSRTEDGNARAIEFARRVRYLMHEVGCSVVVLDHTGYAHDEPRDASAKRQQVDVCVLMDRVGEWEPGRPARFSMENRKAARFGNPFRFAGQIVGNRGEDLDLEWSGAGPE